MISIKGVVFYKFYTNFVVIMMMNSSSDLSNHVHLLLKNMNVFGRFRSLAFLNDRAMVSVGDK